MEIHITKKDVLWGYIAQFFNIGAGILLLPVILKLLPADILGVWYIFLTISSLVQMTSVFSRLLPEMSPMYSVVL